MILFTFDIKKLNMLFKEIPGNDLIKKQLVSTVKNNRISHAQLFTGNRGSAKLALAFAYARYINCKTSSENDSCGKCPSCFKYNSLSHPDLHLIFPVLKQPGLKSAVSDVFVKQWRSFILNNTYDSLENWITFMSEKSPAKKGAIYKDEAISIQKKISLKNFEAEYKVIIIWMPEKMNVEASNKLLKVFEEPPKRTVFLLVSDKPKNLLPTLNSRLQKIKISDFKTNDIIAFFKNKSLTVERANQLVNLTGSDLGKIIRIVEDDSEEGDLLGRFSSWMRTLYKVDVVNLSNLVESISKMGKNNQKTFLLYAIKIIRECLIYNYANKSLLKANLEEITFISKFSAYIHEENSLVLVEKLEEAIQNLDRNANSKILLFELSLQIIKILKVKRKFAVN